jgi:phage terminase large subunit GpA-like protein
MYAMACPQCGQDQDLVVRMSGWYHLQNDDPADNDDATTMK